MKSQDPGKMNQEVNPKGPAWPVRGMGPGFDDGHLMNGCIYGRVLVERWAGVTDPIWLKKYEQKMNYSGIMDICKGFWNFVFDEVEMTVSGGG